MKLIIDTDKVLEKGIPMDSFLYMLSIYLGQTIYSQSVDNLLSDNYIEYISSADGMSLALTQEGHSLIESICTNKEKVIDRDKARFDKLAYELMQIFPEGTKDGTHYKWRDNLPTISQRLRSLTKRYAVNFTDDEAINAAKNYVQSFNGNYTYMQLLKYFISKKNVNTGEEVSQLLSYIQNPEEADNNNWLTNMV